MKRKHYQLKPNRIAVVLLIIFAVLGTTLIVILTNRDNTEASLSLKPNTNKAVQSQFSFDAAKVSGWSQGPTNATSMAVFADNKDCWISVERKPGVVNEASEISNNQAKLVQDGYTVTLGEKSLLTLQSNNSKKQYTLHQQSVAGTGGAGQVYSGQAFGYVQLDEEYVFVQGYCDISDHLTTIIPALQSIKFDDTK